MMSCELVYITYWIKDFSVTLTSLSPSLPLHSYRDDISADHYHINTAFQVFLQPQTYSVHAVGEKGAWSDPGPTPQHSQLEWHARERTYIVHGLLVQLTPASY